MKRLLPNFKNVSKLAICFVLFAGHAALAQVSYTWVGTTSNWNSSTNWNPSGVPTAVDNVTITSAGNTLSISSAQSCNNLTINSGSIELNAGANLTVNGNFTNLGAISQIDGDLTVVGTFTQDGFYLIGDGNVIIKGSLTGGGDYEISGGTFNYASTTSTALNPQEIPALPYFNLTISGSGEKKLLGSTLINGNLTFIGSTLTTNNPSADILELKGNISGETASNYFIGTLKRTESITTTGTANFGGIGVTFQNTTNANWGNVTVFRTTGGVIKNPNDDRYESITRQWNIVPQFQANSNVNLTLNWLTSEDNSAINDFSTKKAQVWKREGSDPWQPVGTASMATASNGTRTMTVATTSFSNWAISAENSPLPVTWLYFNGTKTETGTELTWATATEKNSEAFIIERSANGKNFEAIGTVKAAGNSTQTVAYNFTDKFNTAGKIYYRLKQTDLDGTFSYSAIIAIAGNSRFVALKPTVYPNPFNETLNIRLNAEATVRNVVLRTLEGKEIYRKNIQTASDLTLNALPVLSAGMYLLQIESDNGTTTVKVNRQ